MEACRLRSELRSAIPELVSLYDTNRALNAELSDRRVVIDTLEHDSADLASQLSSLRLDHDRLDQDLRDMTDRVQSLTMERDQLSADLAALRLSRPSDTVASLQSLIGSLTITIRHQGTFIPFISSVIRI